MCVTQHSFERSQSGVVAATVIDGDAVLWPTPSAAANPHPQALEKRHVRGQF